MSVRHTLCNPERTRCIVALAPQRSATDYLKYPSLSSVDYAELFAAVAGAARMLGHVCAPSLIQRAVAQCCDIMPDLEAYDVNRNLLYNGLTEIGYECAKPQGAFYLFVKAPGGDAMAFAEKAKKKNLLIVPSDSFGVPGYFRLSYCVSKEMIERSLPAFKEVFAE